MNELVTSCVSVLNLSAAYGLFERLIRSDQCCAFYVRNYVRPQEGDRILDIGCGTDSILNFLPTVNYVWFDLNTRYIKSVIKQYGNRGAFFCEKINESLIGKYSHTFDIVMANGVLHHLADKDAIMLLEVARSALKPSGRLVTIDGCYVPDQSIFTKFMLRNDRGEYVRARQDYLSVVSQVFGTVKDTIHTGLLRIPYTHITMECSL